MAHVYNDPTQFKDDATTGFVAAYGRFVEKVPNASAVMRRGGVRPGKVSVIIGGGSGHYPAFCGTVGVGFADGAVIGDIFTSPSSEQAYRAGRALNGGAGVLFSFGNYAGDVLNFGIAQERLRSEGIDCRTVLVTDDVASAPANQIARRRGVAGDFIVFKAAGAAAERGDSIEEVERLARKVNSLTTSFGVAFAGCTFPGEDHPLFQVADGKMDLGLGIHGEPGIRTVEWMPAFELAPVLLEPLLAERPAGAHRAAIILNGLGATKYEELFVLWGALAPLFADAGITAVEPEVGELVTSLDMAGCSLTVSWLDDELEPLWRAPAATPAFRRGAAGEQSPSSTARHIDLDDVITVIATGSRESRAIAELVNEAIDAMRVTVETHEAELGRIDAVAGDGDHGIGMVRGLRAASAASAAAIADGAGAAGTLTAAGAAWGDRAGGTSGVLWGAILTALGAELGDTHRPDAKTVAIAVSAAAAALQRLGRCELGDKTMYDALQPFAVSLDARVDAGVGLGEAWQLAAADATHTAADTADLVPRLGRARPLAERSIGTPDAGATSMALLLTAVGDVLAGHYDGSS